MNIKGKILKFLYLQRKNGQFHEIRTLPFLKKIPVPTIKASIKDLKDDRLIEVQDIANSLQNLGIENITELTCKLRLSKIGLENLKKENPNRIIRWAKLNVNLKNVLALCSIISILVTLTFLLFKSKDDDDNLFNQNCQRPFFATGDTTFNVVITRFSEDQSNKIGRLIQSRYESILEPDRPLIRIIYCNNINSILDRESIKKILTTNNADLILFGDFFNKGDYGDTALISYNYALQNPISPNIAQIENPSIPIKFVSVRDVIIGKGQENYDFILYYYSASSYFRNSNWDKAEKYYRKCKELKKIEDVFIGLSCIKLQANEDSAALDIINEGVEELPNSYLLYSQRCGIKNRLHEFKAAVNDGLKALLFQKNVQVDSVDIAITHRSLGQAYYFTKKPDSSLLHMELAIKNDPNEIDWYNLAGLSAVVLEKWDKIEDLYLFGLARNSGNPQLKEELATYYFFKSIIFEDKNDTVNSKNYFQKAINMDSNIKKKFEITKKRCFPKSIWSRIVPKTIRTI